MNLFISAFSILLKYLNAVTPAVSGTFEQVLTYMGFALAIVLIGIPAYYLFQSKRLKGI